MIISVLRTSGIIFICNPDLTVGAITSRPFGPYNNATRSLPLSVLTSGRHATRSLTRQSRALTQPLPKGEEKIALGTDLIPTVTGRYRVREVD
jgi:hypothetical protein